MALEIKKNNIKRNAGIIENALKSGKIVVYPTETCYGIGCIISARQSIDRIYELKKRPKNTPFLVIVSDIEMMREYAVVCKEAELLAKAFMPGPLTLVLKRTHRIPKWFPGKKIGIRIPGNEIARMLCVLAGQAIVSTSANLSGKKPLYAIKEVKRVFGKKIELIIDAGNLVERMPSTVFDLEKKTVLRKGSIAKKKIMSVLREIK